MAFNTDSQIDLRSLEPVSDYDGHLMCPICHCPFIRPLQLSCDHIFCQSCLDSCVSSSGSSSTVRERSTTDLFLCPTCRAPTNSTFKSAPRLIVAMCDEILVKCPFSASGCEEIMERGYVQTHVDKYCVCRLVPCLDASCNKMIRVKDIPSDSHCMHELWECEQCKELIMELELTVLTPWPETVCPLSVSNRIYRNINQNCAPRRKQHVQSATRLSLVASLRSTRKPVRRLLVERPSTAALSN